MKIETYHSLELKKFIRFSAICCFLSVITTLGIHLFFSFPEMSFEERLLLYKNKLYIANRWWVILHCLLVLISMYGVYFLGNRKKKGFLSLGLLFYTIFSITEIFRQIFVLSYLNGLRKKLLFLDDETLIKPLTLTIENFGFMNNSLFILFVFSIGLGNLFFGLSFIKGKGIDRLLGLLLIIWSFKSGINIVNNYSDTEVLQSFVRFFNSIAQPLIRTFVAIWIILTLKKTFANKN